MQLRNTAFTGALLSLLAPFAAGDNLIGKVVDINGSPVANVDLDVFDQATGNEIVVNNGDTDSTGFFNAEIPGPGVYKVIFTPPTSSLFIGQVENLVVSGTKDMGVITLPPAVVLSGRVLRPNGTGYPNLDLDLVDPATGDAWDVPGDQTDASGYFSIPAPVGEVELQFEPNPNDVPLVAPDRRFLDLTANTDLGDVQLELGYWIDLRVLRPGGAPVVGADLDAFDLATLETRHTPGDNTNSLGQVDFVVPAGTYELEICPKLGDKLVTKVLGPVVVNGDVNLGTTTLAAGWYLSGTVTDTQGTPLAKVDLDAIDELTGLDVPLCGEKTDGSGNYTIVLPTGTFEIEFEPPAGSPLCDLSVQGVVVNSDTVLDATLSECCGTTYCGSSQNPNNVAVIAIDTCDSASSSITLSLSSGPPNQFVYLLVGNGSNTVSQPPGAKGDLCVVGGSCLGRYDKDVGQITAGGTFALDIKSALSNPCQGAVNIVPGATWNFQFWHRQPMGQPATFSSAISVTFE